MVGAGDPGDPDGRQSQECHHVMRANQSSGRPLSTDKCGKFKSENVKCVVTSK